MIKVNGKKVTNPIAQVFWGVIGLLITLLALVWSFMIVALVFLFILSPIWIPALLIFHLIK